MNVLESLEGVGVVPSNTDTYSLKQFRDGFDIVTKTGGACEIKCAQGNFVVISNDNYCLKILYSHHSNQGNTFNLYVLF